jgi:hypothetical protein
VVGSSTILRTDTGELETTTATWNPNIIKTSVQHSFHKKPPLVQTFLDLQTIIPFNRAWGQPQARGSLVSVGLLPKDPETNS